MTIKLNIEAYKKSQNSANFTKSPYDIVQSLMEHLIKSMEKVVEEVGTFRSYTGKKNNLKIVNNKSKHITKSLTIIYSLQVSLDFEKAPEIAQSFFQLYEYCRQQILKALTKNSIEGVQKAIMSVEEILNGWKMITKENK